MREAPLRPAILPAFLDGDRVSSLSRIRVIGPTEVADPARRPPMPQVALYARVYNRCQLRAGIGWIRRADLRRRLRETSHPSVSAPVTA